MSRNKSSFKEQDGFRKVDRFTVKRSFVISEHIRRHGMGRRYLPRLSREEFHARLQEAKESILALDEPELDEIIARNNKKRLREYNCVDWYEGVVFPDEVGVWKSAGGLPIGWTYGSLEDTAETVRNAYKTGLDKKIVARARRAISRMTEHLDIIEREPYLYPIILPGGTMGRGNRGRSYERFHLLKGDIDDGCIRSISLVNMGRRSIHAYIGLIS